MSQVVTRFAPSPTGFLHIGGARTALFNWLYARRFGGKFLLRIEDTDRQRSTEAAVEAIMDGLKWLGLDWDGEAISQFERAGRHREVAYQLLAAGGAYRCYASTEELEAMREKARLDGKPMRYDGRWRDRDPALARAGVAPVIRLKARQDGETVINDLVQGKVTFANKDLDDLVLLRSDGNPTYMLAVVVDDHDMGVTHVIRGDDHLTNAARQTQIYQALGWDIPAMAHIPLIHGPDGAKLSKRHGALGVDAYRAMGYLPAALRNYLARLGWSHGDKEFFTTEELIAAFGLAAVGRSPSRFDYAKLENVNGHYMRAASDAELFDALIDALPYLKGGTEVKKIIEEEQPRARLRRAIPGLKPRVKTLVELLDGARRLLSDDEQTSEAKKIIAHGSAGNTYITQLSPILQYNVSNWSPANTEQIIRDYASKHNIKLGEVAQPLRAAITGDLKSAGIFDVLDVVGREETVRRLAFQSAPQGFLELEPSKSKQIVARVQEALQHNKQIDISERINVAVHSQGSIHYITPSGATLTLMTELAGEGNIEGISLAYIALSQAYPENSHFVASTIPGKLTNGYFIKYLNIEALRFAQWDRKNPHWAEKVREVLNDAPAFVATINGFVEAMLRAIPG